MGINITDLPPRAQAQALRKLQKQGTRKSLPSDPFARVSDKKAAKYHNTPTERVTPEGGVIKFDSTKEARRYDELMVLLGAGKIRNLKLQPQFTLQESYKTTEGVRVRAIRYVADFCYEIQHRPEEWRKVVEDVKSRGTRTREYQIKRKMLKDKLGITITEV